MSGISEERLASIESALGGSSHGKQIHELIAEIRRLREVNRKRNHCVECGNLNPVDNVCDGCYQQLELGM